MTEPSRQLRPYNVQPLIAAQARLGWTNERLASIAGVHPATVGRLLNGQTQKRSTVMVIANALGVTLSELVARPEVAA